MTFSNRGSFGGNRAHSNSGFTNRAEERPALHDAVCAKCGSACQVPFVPNGRKEVFCSRCFGEMNGGERDMRNSQRFERRDSRPPKMFDRRDAGSNFSDRQLYSVVCDTCGDNCKVPFEPRNGNPVLCSNCFSGKKRAESRTDFETYPKTTKTESKDYGREFESINVKLDKILKLLSQAVASKTETIISTEAVVEPETEKVLSLIQESLVKKAKKASKIKK